MRRAARNSFRKLRLKPLVFTSWWRKGNAELATLESFGKAEPETGLAYLSLVQIVTLDVDSVVRF